MHFVDIHSHILPGVDDGARSLEDSLQLLRRAHASGTRCIAATPHMFLEPFNNRDPERIRARFLELTGRLRELSREPGNHFLQEMEIVLGAENYVSTEFLDALDNRRLLTLNGTRHLLIESSPYLPVERFVEVLSRIQLAGYVPVVAHVERLSFSGRDGDGLQGLAEMGCLLQMNGKSVLSSNGMLGRLVGHGPQRRCLRLLKRGIIHLIASDSHDVLARPPDLLPVYQTLRKEFREEQVHSWMELMPRKVLKNETPGL